MIDLHTHTTASDGSLPPEKLVDLARAMDLKAIAVTDHDTVSGVAAALRRGREIDFEVVPGVEISVEFKQGTMHILGYFIDHQHPDLTAVLHKLQNARQERNQKIALALTGLGKTIDLKKLEQAAGGQVGRPHFAQALVEGGHAADMQDAFDRYLKKGGPAYVDKFRLTPQDGLDLIRRAGGLPVLAHPFTLNISRVERLTDQLIELKNGGLKGLEVYYPEHTQDMTDTYFRLARHLDLAVTGGTDFHGDLKPDVILGLGHGGFNVPDGLLEELKSRREGQNA